MLGAGSGDGDRRFHRTELKLDGGQIEAKGLLSWELMGRPGTLVLVGLGLCPPETEGREGGNEASEWLSPRCPTPPQPSFTPWNPGDLLYVLLPLTQQPRAGRGAGGQGDARTRSLTIVYIT